MTVAQLIEKLQKFPQDAAVTVMKEDFAHDISAIELEPNAYKTDDIMKHWYREFWLDQNGCTTDGFEPQSILILRTYGR